MLMSDSGKQLEESLTCTKENTAQCWMFRNSALKLNKVHISRLRVLYFHKGCYLQVESQWLWPGCGSLHALLGSWHPSLAHPCLIDVMLNVTSSFPPNWTSSQRFQTWSSSRWQCHFYKTFRDAEIFNIITHGVFLILLQMKIKAFIINCNAISMPLCIS